MILKYLKNQRLDFVDPLDVVLIISMQLGFVYKNKLLAYYVC